MRTNFWAGLSVTGLAILATCAVLTSGPKVTQAHCQVPCGIYDDAARIAGLREDATTIAKAINNIKKLSGSHDAEGFNQLVRWINTKETVSLFNAFSYSSWLFKSFNLQEKSNLGLLVP